MPVGDDQMGSTWKLPVVSEGWEEVTVGNSADEPGNGNTNAERQHSQEAT